MFVVGVVASCCMQSFTWKPFSFEPKVWKTSTLSWPCATILCLWALWSHTLQGTQSVIDVYRVHLPCGRPPAHLHRRCLTTASAEQESVLQHVALPFQPRPGLQTQHQSSQIPASGVDIGKKTSWAHWTLFLRSLKWDVGKTMQKV